MRDHLLPLRKKRATRLYGAAVGSLVNARGVIDALAEGRIDVGPLDSYSHDLLKHYHPVLAARVRTIASTVMRPIPPIVATAAIGADTLARLRDALLGTRDASELAAPMARLQLAGFAVPEPSDYDSLAAIADGSAIPLEDL